MKSPQHPRGSDAALIGARQVYPVLRLFPVWKRMLMNDTDWVWQPDWYRIETVKDGAGDG